MNEKPKRIDINDPDFADVKTVLAEMDAEAEQNIKSWEDLYTSLQSIAEDFYEEPAKPVAERSITLLLSFVLALRELPDEGDALNIAKKMHEIFLTRPDLTGVTVFVGSKAKAMAALQVAATLGTVLGSVMGHMVQEEEAAEGQMPTADTNTKKTLH